MDELVFNKNNFNIKELNSIIEQFCNDNSMNKEKVLNLQLVAEEFLSNILFPNFDKDVSFLVSLSEGNVILSFEYEGVNFMNKINEQTILSLKILRNKAKEIISDTKDNKTNIKFVV